MSKAMKQKLKERRQQCALSAESVTGFAAEQSCCFEDAPNSETLCEVSAWDTDFVNSDEQSEFDQYDERDSTISCESVSAEMARENLKSKLVAMRHKSDPSVLTEQFSDYPDSLNARDTVSPPILVQDGVPDNVQEWSTIGERLSLQHLWNCLTMGGATSTKKVTGTMIRLEEQRKIKSPV